MRRPTCKRGRPSGWRKENGLHFPTMVRLSEDDKGWLAAEAARRCVTESDVLRALVVAAREGRVSA